MAKPLDELRERLLRAGVAPRHVRRYINELSDHLADLIAEEERAARGSQEAKLGALARLGNSEDLAKAMIERRQFRSWSARAPWATFGLVPLLVLAGAYFIASVYLWLGWRSFLADADTPFIPMAGPVYALKNVYFQAGKLFYFSAPVLVGWGVGLIAARQRIKLFWPTAGLVMMAWMGATAQIHAWRSAVRHEIFHVRMNFFTVGPGKAHDLAGALLITAVIFTLAALPYLLWRIWQGVPFMRQSGQ
jgi:hypothetical protein